MTLLRVPSSFVFLSHLTIKFKLTLVFMYVCMFICELFHQVGGTICDGANCYIHKCIIYYA